MTLATKKKSPPPDGDLDVRTLLRAGARKGTARVLNMKLDSDTVRRLEQLCLEEGITKTRAVKVALEMLFEKAGI